MSRPPRWTRPIQLQYLRLLKDIQEQTGAAIIFITHDFGIVARMCDRVAVMYAGRIVEQSDVEDMFDRPAHPYTEALLESVPDLDTDVDMLPSIEGQPPSLDALPEGCTFAPRCPHRWDRCITNTRRNSQWPRVTCRGAGGAE